MMDFKEIPIFIISYNRLDCLKQLISRLEKDGYNNLIIIDNASTDKYLLEYLHALPYKVNFLDKNYGHMVLWNCGLFNNFIENNYYVLTDPDVLPVDECPLDFIEHFYDILQLYPEKTKVGFSLKIDDLPETFINKYDIIRWETFFYEHKLSLDPLLYEADIDTTFALYRPGYPKKFYRGIRTGFPYTARHLGWYINKKSLSDEEKIYFESANSSFSSFNDSAMYNVRFATIRKILEMQGNIDFYTLNKRLIKAAWLKNITFKDILRTTIFLLSKKIRQHCKNTY